MSEKVNNLIWAQAAGRCQFRGCNKEVWHDDLLKTTPMNKSNIAHIVAESEKGVRGDPVRSPLLKNDPNNLMLLCFNCHDRIDDQVTGAQWTEKILLDFKHEHQERIRHYTSFCPSHEAEWLLYTARIGDRIPRIQKEKAWQAILESHLIPATEQPLSIDSTPFNQTDAEDVFWEGQARHLEREISARLHPLLQDSRNKKLCIFGLAPMPLLAKLGHTLGQMVEILPFQLQRGTDLWEWVPGDGNTQFHLHDKEAGITPELVALSISISGEVNELAMQEALAKPFFHYSIKSDPITPMAVRTRGDLKRFAEKFLDALTLIGQKHPGVKEIAVFPAVPNSVAVEMGRQKLPKGHPALTFYDYNGGTIFKKALSL